MKYTERFVIYTFTMRFSCSGDFQSRSRCYDRLGQYLQCNAVYSTFSYCKSFEMTNMPCRKSAGNVRQNQNRNAAIDEPMRNAGRHLFNLFLFTVNLYPFGLTFSSITYWSF